MLGVIGTKLGMTRVFKENGTSVPVTVIEVAKSKIVQRKTPEKDGYYAIQVNFGSKKNGSIPSRLQVLVEMSYDFIANMVKDNVGNGGKPYFPFIFTLFKLVIGCYSKR